MVKLLGYSLLLATPICFSAGNEGLSSYQETQLDFLKHSSAISQDKRIQFEGAIKNGNISDTVPVERIDKNEFLIQQMDTGEYGVMSPSGGDVLRRRPQFNDQTVPGVDGEKEAENYKVEIPRAELERRRVEINDCLGQLDNGSGQRKMIAKGFTSLSSDDLIVTPGVSLDRTYTRGLSSLSSIIDSDYRHVCDVSVARKGLWVTAKHCVDDNNVSRLSIIVEDRVVSIDGVVKCAAGCDVAFLYAETPGSATIPKLLSTADGVGKKMPLFIPGIPYSANMSGVFAAEPATLNKSVTPLQAKNRYNDLVMWSPYNQGFCMIMNVEANGCMVHACSTVTGFSGAPVYTYDEGTRSLILVGVHSGADPDFNKCAKGSGKANYAMRVTSGDLPK